MNIYRCLHSIMLLGTLLVISSQTVAHTLKETNARVILRDGQVEVRIITDIAHWQKLLQDEKSWLIGDTSQVMPLDLSPTQSQTFLKNLLEQKTKIVLNSQSVVLEMAASTESIDEHSAEIILRGQHSVTSVDKVNITFPKSLGSVYVSFAKPQYKMLAAGSTAVAQF